MASGKRRGARHVYLLRLWEERGDDSAASTYRCILIDSRTHERHGFGDLDQLGEFLRALVEAESAADRQP
jgi:hypothetical protein